MMMKKLTKYVFPLAVLTACLAPSIGLAGLIGDPVPALNVSEWIKGGPVEIKPGTNYFVVEIMQTKFPTSRASLTNLNDIQKRFKANGVVVVAVSDEAAQTVKDFVQQQGTNLDFAIGADNKRHTSLAYMKPVMRQGLPYAFVIGTNGLLFWHGQPSQEMGEVLGQIISGRYDMSVAQKLDVAHHQLGQYLSLTQQGSDRAGVAGHILLANRTNDVPLLCEMAFIISDYPGIKHRDLALANEALDRAEQLAATTTNSLSVGLARAYWLLASGKENEALAKARQVLASEKSPQQQTNVQSVIRNIESKIAFKKAHQNDTNQVNAAQSPDRASGANADPAKDSAGKP